MKKEHLVIIAAFIFGLLVWTFDSAIDSLYFYENTFLNLLIFEVPAPELFFRAQVVIFFTIFGVIISWFFSKHRKAEDALRRTQDELEKRVAQRTKKFEDANKLLNSEIADRIKAENKLLQNQIKLVAVFDGISDPLLLVNKDFEIDTMNKKAVTYYGIKNNQSYKGKKCHTLFGDDLNPCEGCQIPSTNQKNQPTFFERPGIFDPQKTEKVVTYPILDKNDELEYILIRISDITERKIFESHLVQSEKMSSLGMLVSSIAHEINNPNTFISFNIPILREYIENLIPIIDKYADKDPDFEICNMKYTDFRQDLVTILDNVEHGSIRINDFIAYLKDFIQLQDSVKEEWIDLNKVIDNAISIVSVQLRQRVKQFNKNIPDNLPQIWSDSKALEQILINLLVNASEASENKDLTIELNVNVNRDWLSRTVLEVKDNGNGMDEAVVKKIFNPFFTTKSHAKGTGLGLYVCKGLVERLNGKLEVDSLPGKGSTFRLILPAKDRRSQKRL